VKIFRLFSVRKEPTRKRGRLVLPPAEYQILIISVFRRDNYKCRCCKLRRPLHAHHVKYRSQGGDDAEYNLLSLCEACHEAEHDRYLLIEGPTGWPEGKALDCNGPLTFKTLGGWTPGERTRKKKRTTENVET
jgi:hypothetical protein